MPGRVVPGRRRPEDSPLDSPEEDDQPSPPSSDASGSNKRARLNGDEDIASSRNPVLPNGFRRSPARALEYQPGSIVRVKLGNFVTYTAAEFHLGPSLNMVIGPNGTGKSTLVCAICLGLGWNANLLGRSKDISEYVKHGKDHADIEIELKGGPVQRGVNPVIRRNIKRKDGKSTWYLNGQVTIQTTIKNLAKSFAIQLDNLCSFLPQDRVVEFAALSPTELLQSTQEAAGSQKMVDWHSQLKRLRLDQKKEQADLSARKEGLDNLERRQAQARPDVERLREREKTVNELALLEKILPFAQYATTKRHFDESKAAKEQAQASLNQLKEEVEPSLRAVNAKQSYRDQNDQVVAHKKRLVERARRGADETTRKLQRLEEAVKECEKERQAEVLGDRTRRDEQRRIEGKIRDIERQMDQEPPECDAAAYNEQIRAKVREMRELETRSAELAARIEEQRNLGRQKNGRVLQANKELEILRSQAGQQTNKLRLASRDSATAWEWIQNNRDKFQGPIYGPPIVSCSVKDPNRANQLESLFQQTDLRAFTVTTSADFKTLSDQLYGRKDQDKLGLVDVTIKTQSQPLDRYRPPASDEERRQYGLDGWALDFLSGPDVVLAMLCDSMGLHQYGVVSQNVREEQYKAIEASNVAGWVTMQNTYSVARRREYGPGAATTRVRDVRPARFWTNQPVDLGAERELRDNINGWTEEVNAIEIEIRGISEERTALKAKYDDLQREKADIEREKNMKQKALSEFQGLPTQLVTWQDKLQNSRRSGAEVKQRLYDVADREAQLTLEKGQVPLDYALTCETLRNLTTGLIEAELRLLEAQNDLDCLIERNSEVKNMLEEKRREVQAAGERVNQFRQEGKRWMAEVKKIQQSELQGGDGGVAREQLKARLTQERINGSGGQLPEDYTLTPGDVETEIEAYRASLELVHAGDPRAIQTYEANEEKLARLREEVAGKEERLAGLQGSISAIRQLWEPQLDALACAISAAFSTNFAQIGCQGEIRIHKDEEDFDRWAIQTLVKFRENEKLSVLDSHRQSGGERAVSTIFYLMALQSLARSPFRVVDEINQGMDPRNERMVHERIVDVACGGGGGDGPTTAGGDGDGDGDGGATQYFLITPKLLPGLKYRRGMKVHCIASGEWMPADHRDLDFSTCLRLQRAVKADG